MKFLIIFLLVLGCSKSKDPSISTHEFDLELMWSYPFDEPSSPSVEPLIENNYIFTTGGPGLHKIDKHNGSQIWFSKYSSLASSLMNSRLIHNESIVIGLVPNQALGFNKSNGDIVWESTILEYNYLYQISYGTKSENNFFVGSEPGKLFRIEISTGMTEEIYDFNFILRDTYAFNQNEFLILMGMTNNIPPVTNLGRFSIIDSSWIWLNEVEDVGSFTYGYPIIENNKIYMGATQGYFGCFNKKSGEVIWENYAKELFSRDFSISDGKIFINCVDRVCCLDQSTGELLWVTEKIGTSEFSRVFQRNGFVYWARSKGFYVYDAETGEKLLYHSNPDGGYSWTSTITDSAYYVQTAFNLFKYKLLAKVDD